MVLEYIINVIIQTENKGKLQFLQTKNSNAGNHVYKVTMGVMPDYAFDGKGMRVDGVTEGKPAAAAGLKQGDIIIGLGDYPVNTTMDYMKALGNFKKGDTTKVKILRGGVEMLLDVTF